MVTAAIHRTAGALLAIGALLMVIGNLLHARPEPALEDMMATVAEGATVWRLSHGLIMFGTILLAMGALDLIVGRTGLTDRWSTFSAWTALVIVLPIITVAIVAELSVFPMAAEAGDLAAFERWDTFAFTGITHSALLIFLAFFLIAGDQFQRDDRVTHRWAAGVGAVAALAGVVGAVIVGILGMRTLLPMLGVSLLITFVWVLWFGIGLLRSEAGAGSVKRSRG